ncbi:unnamed protein product [Diabrotica balteata]|uniref:Uncharacterized protein n=1 Tax=Diabrotica balteata TaxID=107213 RepID=A0A9N9XFX2_DIABA|nr:unnamed protein product [Diabrotica balteata]
MFNMKLFLICVLIVVLAQNSFQEELPRECGQNEEAGCEPCCPEQEITCQNKKPRPCPELGCLPICNFKCVCVDGYIRDTISGKCVKNC